MNPLHLTYFAITLFLALAGLIKWKYRKDDLRARLNRGLKGYVQSSGVERATRIPHHLAPQEIYNQQASNEDMIVA